MPIKSYKVGPGLFTVGAAGTLQTFTAQMRGLTVEWSEEVEDAVPTLSGEELEGEATYSATLSGKVLQDLTDGGMVAWTWTNKGQRFPFTYTPNSTDDTLEDATITGTVRVAPLNVGGDVKSRPESDLSWACIGEPELVHGLAG